MYPMTKVVPKELFPLVDRPVILKVMEEAQRAGVENFHLVTSVRKPALREFFTPNLDDDSRNPRAFPMPKVNFVTQDEPRGLGHAVLQAREVVGNEPFVVQLPDDVFHEEDPILQSMLQIHGVTGGCVVALLEVGKEEIGAYSTTRVTRVDLPAEVCGGHEVFRLTDIVEKPTPEQVKSPYALMGRYVLSPKIFEVLSQTPPGRNNEIQLTDALATLADTPVEEGGGVWGVVCRGRHFDTGNLVGYVTAQAELAAEHPLLGKSVRDYLRHVLCSQEQAGGNN